MLVRTKSNPEFRRSLIFCYWIRIYLKKFGNYILKLTWNLTLYLEIIFWSYTVRNLCNVTPQTCVRLHIFWSKLYKTQTFSVIFCPSCVTFHSALSNLESALLTARAISLLGVLQSRILDTMYDLKCWKIYGKMIPLTATTSLSGNKKNKR